MNKNLRSLLFSSIVLAFIFSGSSVSAQNVIDQIRETATTTVQKYFSGAACGVSSQGICKESCDPYDDIIDSTTAAGGGQSTCPRSEQCCMRTRCASTNLGVGTCKSSGSCEYGFIGTYTSDCAPPKTCCVAPNTAPANNTSGAEVTLPSQIESSGNNVFTGENEEQAAGGSAASPLVPCDGFDCSLCSFFTLTKNIINLLIEITFALAGGFIVWGAIEIMTAGANEGGIKSGKEKITTAVMGIAITLSGWLIIGTALQILTDSSSVLPWNKIECSSKPLGLSPIVTGNDSACISKGGFCQNPIIVCENGKYEDGLCNSIANRGTKCCVPNVGEFTCEKVKNNKCMSPALGARYRVGLGTCPSGQECFDVSAPIENINPQL